MKLNNAWAIIADKIEFVFSYNQANTTPLKKFTGNVLYVGIWTTVNIMELINIPPRMPYLLRKKCIKNTSI